MRLILSVAIWCFAAVVVIGGMGFVVLDAMDKVESIQRRAPWITKILERRNAFVALLMICTVLLIGDAYELFKKELPEVPAAPIITFSTPAGPRLIVNQVAPAAKEQCWVKNYAAPSFPSWSIAAVFCNTTIKPPLSIELEYNQTVNLGVFAFPVGSEFSTYQEYNESTKAFAMVDTHTIVPNEPFTIMASGSIGKFPLVKSATIRAKGRLFAFHP